MMEERDVLVVGAGISGLAAAWLLERRGRSVAVLEPSPRIGGVMQTRIADGFLCEAGPTSFQNAPEIMALIEAAGLGGEVVEADGRLPRYVFLGGRLHPVPMSPVALIGTPLLSGAAKRRLLREPWIPPRSDPSPESLADFVSRRLGPEVLRNFVAPFVSGIYAGDAARLETRSVFPSLVEYEQRHGSIFKGLLRKPRAKAKPAAKRRPRRLISFREGLHTLPRKLAADLGPGDIRVGARIESIRPPGTSGSRWTVGFAAGGEHTELAARTLVLAAPAHAAAELARPFAPALATELGAIEYPPLAELCLAWPRADMPHPLAGFGFLAPRGEGLRALGCIWSTSLFPGRAPEGWVLVTVFIGGATDPEVDTLDEGGLVEAARRDLRAALGVEAAPRVVQVERYRRAIPQYTLGHAARLERIERARARFPGLELTGNYLRGVSAGDCVKLAGELTERLCGSVRGAE
jgi:oxygen-dependent protoporphyrinogen oxidase